WYPMLLIVSICEGRPLHRLRQAEARRRQMLPLARRFAHLRDVDLAYKRKWMSAIGRYALRYQRMQWLANSPLLVIAALGFWDLFVLVHTRTSRPTHRASPTEEFVVELGIYLAFVLFFGVWFGTRRYRRMQAVYGLLGTGIAFTVVGAFATNWSRSWAWYYTTETLGITTLLLLLAVLLVTTFALYLA